MPDTNFNNSRDDWNSRTSAFTLVRTNTASQRDFKARNSNFGVTGWNGLWHKDGNTSSSPACSNGFWVPKDGVASVNNYYNAGDSARRRSTGVHEFGHAIGLEHNEQQQPCPGSSNVYYVSVMAGGVRFNGPCATFYPQADDLAGVDYLY